jgi:hypothetical protein
MLVGLALMMAALVLVNLVPAFAGKPVYGYDPVVGCCFQTMKQCKAAAPPGERCEGFHFDH